MVEVTFTGTVPLRYEAGLFHISLNCEIGGQHDHVINQNAEEGRAKVEVLTNECTSKIVNELSG